MSNKQSDAAKLLLRITNKLLNHLFEIDKYGNLNLIKIQKKLNDCPSAMFLLKSIGFKASTDRTRLIWGHNDETLHLLHKAHDEFKGSNEKYPISTVLKVLDDSTMCEDKAMWIDKGIDEWWINSIPEPKFAAQQLEMVGVVLKMMENLIQCLPENANMTQKEERLYSRVRSIDGLQPLLMMAGFKQNPHSPGHSGALIFDCDDDECIRLLRSTYIRLKDKRRKAMSNSTLMVKEAFATERCGKKLSVWNCPLCTFLNEGDANKCAICAASRGPSMNEDLIKLGLGIIALGSSYREYLMFNVSIG